MAKKSIGLLNIVFGADLRGFDRAMKKAQKSLKKFGSSMKRTGANLTRNVTLPLLALGAASIKAFDTQAKAVAQVEAGLKSTGNQVGKTSKELQKMAADLQRTTLFGDEEILQGATAQLLTFTNIAGEQFERTQKVALDLATRLDGDLKSSSIMLGKALNDPVANLSALSRAGIQFSTEQKAVVKSLVETNRLADAQTIILDELEKQYGGSAAAAAKAGLGPIQQLGNSLSDMSEAIGEALLPTIQDLANWIKKIADKFDKLDDAAKKNIVKWGLIVGAIGPVLMIIGQISIGLGALIPIIVSVTTSVKLLTLAFATNPIGLFAIALAGLTAAFFLHKKEVRETTDQYGELSVAKKGFLGDIEKETAETNRLFTLAKNVNIEGELRKTVIDNINSAYGQYLPNLLTEKSSLTEIETAYNLINNALINKIALQSQEKELNFEGQKTYKNQVEAVNDLAKALNLTEGEAGVLMKSLIQPPSTPGGGSWVKFTDEFNSLAGAMHSSNDKYKDASKAVFTYKDATNDLGKRINWIKGRYAAYLTEIVKVNNELDKPKPTGKGFTPTAIPSLGPILLPVEGEEGSPIALAEDFELLNNKIGTTILLSEQLKAALGETLQEGAESFQEFGNLVLNSIRDIIGALISEGVAAAVSSSLKNPIFAVAPYLIPVVAGLAAGLAKTAFNSLIPAFAQGGLVSGPTMSLVGEGSGTSMANPEVIAPLDKLKQYIGGGDMRVTGRLVGNDIFLSNEKAGVSRNRFV